MDDKNSLISKLDIDGDSLNGMFAPVTEDEAVHDSHAVLLMDAENYPNSPQKINGMKVIRWVKI